MTTRESQRVQSPESKIVDGGELTFIIAQLYESGFYASTQEKQMHSDPAGFQGSASINLYYNFHHLIALHVEQEEYPMLLRRGGTH
jgi:hypothetical protein